MRGVGEDVGIIGRTSIKSWFVFLRLSISLSAIIDGVGVAGNFLQTDSITNYKLRAYDYAFEFAERNQL